MSFSVCRNVQVFEVVAIISRTSWTQNGSGLTSLLGHGLEARRDDVIVLLALVDQPVPPLQLPQQLGGLQAGAVLHLLDDGAQLLQV